MSYTLVLDAKIVRNVRTVWQVGRCIFVRILIFSFTFIERSTKIFRNLEWRNSPQKYNSDFRVNTVYLQSQASYSDARSFSSLIYRQWRSCTHAFSPTRLSAYHITPTSPHFYCFISHLSLVLDCWSFDGDWNQPCAQKNH